MSEIQTIKLEVIGTIKEGVGIGVKNIGAILVNVILWMLTIWIPYLNVGTTIGLIIGLVSKASRDEPISMTEIFDPKYRKYMGEFFLTAGLMGIGVAAGAAFFLIPAIVIGIAWGLSLLLVVDKGKNPTEALTLSNRLTYGNKWRIFGISSLIGLVFGLVIGILAMIPVIGVILSLAASIFMMAISIGVEASIYKQLAGNA